MESELQRILEGSILKDGLGEFIFPNGMLGMEDALLEEGLMALLQADGQMNTRTPFISDFFSPLQLDSSPFANLEELLKQEPVELLTDTESSGLSSPPSTYDGREVTTSDYTEGVSKPYLEFSGSVDTSPRSCYECVDVPTNYLVEDHWDLENVDCRLPCDFNWDDYQNEMFLNENTSVDVVSESVPVLKKSSSSSHKPFPEKETKKFALRGVKKKTSQLKIKREQNKEAASRYRTKKKEEESCLMLEYEELLTRNEKLKRVALDKEQEVKVLRKLLKDVLGK